ncbi:MAG: cytochrome P450 [Actinobacteria bacterium]|nr:cytochrome P450 [Actinomycetota bacterium]
MTSVSYDPYDYAIHDDPYPTYTRLRDEAPVYRNDDLGFWALSRHADVGAAFRDPARFSSAEGVTLDPAATGPHAHRTMSFLALDDPRHGRLRGLVSRGFTPRRVAELEPHIRELTRSYLDPLVDADSFDFIADFAARLPMDVISELMGVPTVDREEVQRLANVVVHRDEGARDVPPAAVEAAFGLAAYYAAMVDDRRRVRTDDLTSALIDAEVDGAKLTDDEIIGFLFLMVVAGNETTTKLLGNAWYWAWRNPEQRAKPFDDPTRIPAWVEETVRFDTSTQMLARTATEDVRLHGVDVPAGGRVLLLVGSANRDDRVFPEPDRYEIERDTTDLLSFGLGRHYCLGAALARLEARVALEEVVNLITDYEVDARSAIRVHSVNVRGFASLPSVVRARVKVP